MAKSLQYGSFSIIGSLYAMSWLGDISLVWPVYQLIRAAEYYVQETPTEVWERITAVANSCRRQFSSGYFTPSPLVTSSIYLSFSIYLYSLSFFRLFCGSFRNTIYWCQIWYPMPIEAQLKLDRMFHVVLHFLSLHQKLSSHFLGNISVV